jgi:ATP citrate (pro-S)-lyase
MSQHVTTRAGDVLAPLVSALPLELRPTIEAFLANCLAVFDDLDATLLEMNPFTFDSNGMPFPLDIRMVSSLYGCRIGWLL